MERELENLRKLNARQIKAGVKTLKKDLKKLAKFRIKSSKEGQRLQRNLKRRKTFECPWCGKTKSKKYQCAKGYCVSCAQWDI